MSKPSEEQTYRQGTMQMLGDIKAQVVKTNGRVTTLERIVYGVICFLIGAVIVRFPAVATFLAGLF